MYIFLILLHHSLSSFYVYNLRIITTLFKVFILYECLYYESIIFDTLSITFEVKTHMSHLPAILLYCLIQVGQYKLKMLQNTIFHIRSLSYICIVLMSVQNLYTKVDSTL